MNNKMGKQKGFTIIELMVVLMILAVMAAIAALGQKPVLEWMKIYQITNQVETIQKAVNGWGLEKGIYTTLSKDKLKDYLPKQNYEWTNTYGGAVNVGAGDESYEWQLTQENIPESVGVRIADKYPDNAVYDKGTTTVTFTFGQ